ncbi:kinase-like domain-containing protein [Chytridium lagenaria]|nr:kinase-like domain-containing protein [Chytridium lagenaria]
MADATPPPIQAPSPASMAASHPQSLPLDRGLQQQGDTTPKGASSSEDYSGSIEWEPEDWTICSWKDSGGREYRASQAWHTHGTNQRVAIKIISKDSLSSSDDPATQTFLQRKTGLNKKIEREITIMNWYDVYETEKELFLILEHVEGGELFDYLVKRGRLLEDEALQFFQQIVYGVDFCHRHLICHRDLKPENLLLDKDRNVKIADFGMASLQVTGKMLETSCGSPHYASPEIIKGIKLNLECILSPEHVSPMARDLIKRMLVVDPINRITMAEVMKHPWFLSRTPANLTQLTQLTINYETALAFAMNNANLIDREVVSSLQLLGWGDEEDLMTLLTAPGTSMEKVFYGLLCQRRWSILRITIFHGTKKLFAPLSSKCDELMTRRSAEELRSGSGKEASIDTRKSLETLNSGHEKGPSEASGVPSSHRQDKALQNQSRRVEDGSVSKDSVPAASSPSLQPYPVQPLLAEKTTSKMKSRLTKKIHLFNLPNNNAMQGFSKPYLQLVTFQTTTRRALAATVDLIVKVLRDNDVRFQTRKEGVLNLLPPPTNSAGTSPQSPSILNDANTGEPSQQAPTLKSVKFKIDILQSDSAYDNGIYKIQMTQQQGAFSTFQIVTKRLKDSWEILEKSQVAAK